MKRLWDLIIKYWVWGALILLTIPAWRVLVQPGYFAMHDDMQAVRQLEMDKCFADGQVPCRWVLDLGYGYGYPLFNYYPPMPYLLGQLVHWMGVSFLDTVKVVGILGFLASAITMYLLAREFWGKWGGLAAAMIYVYAPYHAVDFYVRGAMNEFWAIAWFPLILWVAYQLIKDNSWRWVPWLAVSYALLLLSHNGMAMIFTVGLGGWVGIWCIKYHVSSVKGVIPNTKYIIQNTGRSGSNLGKLVRNSVLIKLVASGAWGVALGAFFLLPVIFEQRYARVETLIIGYFNYLAHFADIKQLFFQRSWGYGSSVYGPDDGLSFQIGYVQWGAGVVGVVGLGILGMLGSLGRGKKWLERVDWCDWGDRVVAGIYIFLLTMAYAFMTHYKSTEIWKLIKPLEFLQFPWRFLAVVILGFSFLAGAVAWIWERGRLAILGRLVAIGLIVGVMALNEGYFVPREWYPEMVDNIKFSGKFWQLEITSGIFDYLPIQLPLPPADPPNGDVEIINGQGSYQKVAKRSNYQEYEISLSKSLSLSENTNTDNTTRLRLNTFYFPGWKYFINGNEVTDYQLDKEYGVPEFELVPGEYQLVMKFTDTPVRRMGNWLTAVGVIVLGAVGIRRWWFFVNPRGSGSC